jgi:hypothetical protein
MKRSKDNILHQKLMRLFHLHYVSEKVVLIFYKNHRRPSMKRKTFDKMYAYKF